MLRRLAVSGALVAGVACGSADAPEPMLSSGLPAGDPTDVGMVDEGLARIRPAMQAYVDDRRVAGVMTMVARQGRVVHWDAVGLRDLATSDPLEPDDLFRVYSMTKPVTSVAAMILVEQGKVSLDDPVSKFIPEFADVTVLTDADERVEPSCPITVEHLMTHTSGLTYGFFGDSPVDRLYRESGAFTQATSLDDLAMRVAGLPLLASPGERWNYSMSTDVLGRVVEVVSGQPFRRVSAHADLRAARNGGHGLLGLGGEAKPVLRPLHATGQRASSGRLTDGRAICATAHLAVGRRWAGIHRVRLHPLCADASQRG